MKYYLLFIIYICIVGSVQSQGNNMSISKISTELNKREIIHSFISWQLASIHGNNRTELLVEAVEYRALNNNIVLKGIRITLLPDNTTTLLNSKLVTYIDDNNYAEIMVVINQMLIDYKKLEANNMHGGMSYASLYGVKFGFNYTSKIERGYISIVDSNMETSFEYSNIESFLNNMLLYFNTASKELYLPENIEKIKKVKKSKQKIKDVVIDDI